MFVVCSPEKVTISNIPAIVDVLALIDILKDLGVKVEKLSEDTYTFQADEVNLEYLKTDTYKKKGASLRGSIMIMGPLLTRFKKAFLPKPGGDRSAAKVDTHFWVLKN